MRYTKDDLTWLKIRANSGHWFSPSTLRFFGSRIHWQTLAEIDGGYLFVSEEDNWDRSERRFSVRLVVLLADGSYDIETVGEYFTYETLAEAKKELKLSQDREDLKIFLLEKVGA